MIEPKILTQGEWERVHATPGIITASMASTILGINQYESPFTLYHRIIGTIPGPEVNLAMKLGHLMEPVIDKLYHDETGRTPTDPGEYAVFSHADTPWLLATLDRLVFARDVHRRGPAEFKTTGVYSKEWKEGPPLGPQIQLQCQMWCSGHRWGSLAWLVGNQDFFVKDYDINDKFLRVAIQKLRDFKDRCLNGDPPPLDGSDSCATTIKMLHPQDNGAKLAMSEELAERTLKYYELKAQMNALDVQMKAEYNAIIGGMKDHTFANSEGVGVSYRTQANRGKLSVDPAMIDRLNEAGIKFRETPASTHRVLRRM